MVVHVCCGEQKFSVVAFIATDCNQKFRLSLLKVFLTGLDLFMLLLRPKCFYVVVFILINMSLVFCSTNVLAIIRKYMGIGKCESSQ